MTFPQQVRDLLTHLRIEAGLAPATLDAYGRDLRELGAWLASTVKVTEATNVEPEHLVAYVRFLSRERDLCPASITRHIASMRVLFRWLSATQKLDRNPAKLLERPTKWAKIPGTLSPRQMRGLVEAPTADHGSLWIRDRAILEAMYAAGLRASEVGAIRLDEYHTEMAMLTVTGKGSKQRAVPVGEYALRWIETYLRDVRPRLKRPDDSRDKQRLFLSFSGRPLERVAIWQLVRKYAAVAGLDNVHPHILRHSFATHLLIGGADLRVVQDLLGHADVTTTQIYTHVDRSHLREVVKKHHPRP